MALSLVVTANSDPQRRSFRYDFADEREQILIGRRDGVDVLLPGLGVGPVHARIEREGERYRLRRHGEELRLWLNGDEVAAAEARLISAGDTVAIGEFLIEIGAGNSGSPSQQNSRSQALKIVSDVFGVVDADRYLRDIEQLPTAPSARQRMLPDRRQSRILFASATGIALIAAAALAWLWRG